MNRWLRLLAQVLATALLAGGLALLLALWAKVQPQPAVQRDGAATADTAGRVKALLLQHAPRGAGADRAHLLRLSRQDLDLLVHDGLQRAVQGAARVELAEGSAQLQASLPLRSGPLARLGPARLLGAFGPWLNLRARLHATPQGLPALDALHIGHLRVPAALAAWLARRMAAQLNLGTEYDLALDLVEQLRITPEAVELSYHWRPEWRDRLREALIQPADQQRLLACNDQLVALVAPSAQRPAGQPVSLVDLLAPLFEQAQQRAAGLAAVTGQGGLAAEQRAVLITLAIYASAQPMARIVAAARQWPHPHPRTVTLRGRDDFALHFLVSAVLAAEGGGRLADMIGVYKEMADTRGGSGFSFNDIAADRAGTRFGQRSAQQPERLSQRIGPGLREADLLPPLDDLPEFLSSEDFRQRYGEVGSPAYREMLQRIEQRIDTLPVLQ